MKKTLIILSIFSYLPSLGGMESFSVYAQRIANTSMYRQQVNRLALPVPFRADTKIEECTIPAQPVKWGMDVAWISEDNVIRGTNYITKGVLANGVGRVSFQPSDLIDADGNLSATQKKTLQQRLDIIAKSGTRTIVLNCDHEVLCNKESYPNADQNYANYYGKPAEWLKVIKASVKYCKSKGFNVVAISPFNEPDYTAWKEGTQAHFKAIAKLISEDEELKGIRISAGNTLNCDQALSWYNAVKPYVTEGNTHQLAGSMSNYTSFWKTVREDGNVATADELHNTMEAFIGIHHGMQQGIWWGWDGASRGEFCKASAAGKEIGYTEDAATWTGAAVYKWQRGISSSSSTTEERITAFLGGSERQANDCTYHLLSTDRPVYYEGYGPVYGYSQALPGGTGYQKGQVNAERMINIQYGEDVPTEAILSGNYIIMNANSKKCFGYNANNEVLAQQTHSVSNKYYQWTVNPVADNSGGDFGYFCLNSVQDNTRLLDVKDWNTAPGATILVYAGGKGTNEQWFLEYAGDNFWYIRSRHNGLYLDVQNSSTSAGALILTAEFTGAKSQMWRFIPVGATASVTGKGELVAPAQPTGLTATVQSASVKLSWNANTESDLYAYNIVRTTNGSQQTDVIGRLVKETEFVDNDVTPGASYTYTVKAVDRSRNISVASSAVEAQMSSAGEGRALVAHYPLDSNIEDATCNILDALSSGTATFNTSLKKFGDAGLTFNGTNTYLTLPAGIGNMRQMTLSAWVYLNTVSSWSRIFDFGNDTDHYFFLTPNGDGQTRLVMKNGGAEQILADTKLSTGWHFIAVTLSDDAVTLYVDDHSKTSTEVTIRPSDFRPKRNFIGASQYPSDPLFKGTMDDIRIYNYALTAEQIQKVKNGEDIETALIAPCSDAPASRVTYNLAGQRVGNNTKGIVIQDHKKMIIEK